MSFEEIFRARNTFRIYFSMHTLHYRVDTTFSFVQYSFEDVTIIEYNFYLIINNLY